MKIEQQDGTVEIARQGTAVLLRIWSQSGKHSELMLLEPEHAEQVAFALKQAAKEAARMKYGKK